jgi:hypothetical protein
MKVKIPALIIKIPYSIENKFYWYRCFFVVFIYPIATSFITVGDTSSYLDGNAGATNLSTQIMNIIGLFSKIFTSFGVNILVCLITTWTILRALKKLNFTNKTKSLIYCILFTPSFTLYTSILSKEAICTIGCCLFIVGIFEAPSSKFFLNKKILA